MRKHSIGMPVMLIGLAAGSLLLAGCPTSSVDRQEAPRDRPPIVEEGPDTPEPEAPAREATAAAEDVEAAKTLLDGLADSATYTLLPGGVMTEIVVRDGSTLSAENIALFGRLADLEKLHILNYRSLNDELAAQLAGLKNLRSLALTNSVIGDATAEMIAESLPALTELDLSSNTMLTNAALRTICGMSGLESLTLVQTGFNDLGASHLSKLTNLRALDLRGNMEVGDMTMSVVGALPKLTAFKHRSTTVTDFGLGNLAQSQTLEALLMHDFAITGQSGQHLAGLPKLTQLEVFRCQGFGSDGVLALKGMKLSRLTLRDLPMVDDSAMEVFTELPELRRLYLHELSSVGDTGLANLGALESLELLDVWAVPEMTDATVEVIAGLPNLRELSLRETGVTDEAIDRLLAMPNLRALTLKDNAGITAAGLEKLAGKQWSKLDVDSAP